ncbi:hypothetical protein FRC14_001746 [Serendipita sp. 396]|nr:hypothetical protein FRC14_001746 [Serendipita sp. 396]
MPTPASDYHASGCVALEFASLQPPYANHKTTWNILKDINNDLPPARRFNSANDYPGHCIPWDLLEACWRLNPKPVLLHGSFAFLLRIMAGSW